MSSEPEPHSMAGETEQAEPEPYTISRETQKAICADVFVECDKMIKKIRREVEILNRYDVVYVRSLDEIYILNTIIKGYRLPLKLRLMNPDLLEYVRTLASTFDGVTVEEEDDGGAAGERRRDDDNGSTLTLGKINEMANDLMGEYKCLADIGRVYLQTRSEVETFAAVRIRFRAMLNPADINIMVSVKKELKEYADKLGLIRKMVQGEGGNVNSFHCSASFSLSLEPQ